MKTRPVPPAPRCCWTIYKSLADETSRFSLSMTSTAAAVAAAYHGVRAAMPFDLLPYGRNLIVIGTAADSPRLPHARFLPPLLAAACTRLYATRLAPPKNPPGKVHTAWRPCRFSRNVRTCSLVSGFSSHLLSPRLAAAAVAAAAVAVAECTRPHRAT